jgi:hypothetical protein
MGGDDQVHAGRNVGGFDAAWADLRRHARLHGGGVEAVVFLAVAGGGSQRERDVVAAIQA